MERLTGLEQLRHLISSGKRHGIASSLNFNIVSVAEGFAAFEGVPDCTPITASEPSTAAMRLHCLIQPVAALSTPNSDLGNATPPWSSRSLTTKL